MGLTLGPLFTEEMHGKAWCDYGRLRGRVPQCPRFDFRVTNDFYDRDILNGGQHKATDTGNAAVGYPVLAPASCRARGWRWHDGALGIEFDLGGGYTLEAWHLSVTLPVTTVRGVTTTGAWQDVVRGISYGRTGATGATLPDGSPMPAHTHIVLKKNGVPLDAEPHLFMDGQPGRVIEGADDDMAYYDDVPETHPHYADIEWARKNKLTGGTSVDPPLYSPDKPVTRAQMATFLRRAYELDKKEDGT